MTQPEAVQALLAIGASLIPPEGPGLAGLVKQAQEQGVVLLIAPDGSQIAVSPTGKIMPFWVQGDENAKRRALAFIVEFEKILSPAKKTAIASEAAMAQDIKKFAAELSDPIKRMVQSTRIVDKFGEELSFSSLYDLIEVDMLRLFTLFNLDDEEASSSRAVLWLELNAELRGHPHQVWQRKLIEDVTKILCTAPPLDDMPMGFWLVKEYDKLCGSQNAQRLAAIYQRLVKLVASVSGIRGNASDKAVEKLGSVLFPQRAQDGAARKSLAQLKGVDVLLGELNALIGLTGVKSDVVQLANYIKVQQLRKQQGLKTPEISLHMVFYGNPGTGKTTVARLLASIYQSLGVLSKGQLIETDRSGLVAGYVGQTALKVKEVVRSAIGGMLFIDEAYALKGKGGSDYGDEAIETLLKLMEDHRDDLVVIVAGYTEPMNRFLEANPGLKSRFNRYLVFEDYTPAELIQIVHRFCSLSDYVLSPNAEAKLLDLFTRAYANRDETFGNARDARNVFERATVNQSNRIAALEQQEGAALRLIEAEDIELPQGMPVLKLGSTATSG